MLNKFIEYVEKLSGDEKGEAQVFCDRLFQGFGYEGYKEVGATLEHRVKEENTTRFADLLWGERLLIEMKKRGEKLESHRSQLFNYWWNLRPNQPKYAVLCNFDEFYIYDFTIQDEPLDKVNTVDLEERKSAFNFMYSLRKKPIFNNNLEEATKDTAAKTVSVFNSLIERGIARDSAQRFILQCIFCMFAEDFKLLPPDFFTKIISDCLFDDESSYDLIGGLCRQMANPNSASAGRYKDVRYFNGGLFEIVEPIELNKQELHNLLSACKKQWKKINPAIFGTIFQSSMNKADRHAYGAHFTSELDIYKIIHPCLIEPWQEEIEKANSLVKLRSLLKVIRKYKVLDPACGSGNFLYVAFRELKRIELQIIDKIHRNHPIGAKQVGTSSMVSVKQFYGIDNNMFAVELARVTLLFAKEIGIKESQNWLQNSQANLDFEIEEALPLDNLNNNIIMGDSPTIRWESVDLIIGNPPYQSKTKMQNEYGIEYLNKLRDTFPDVSGNVDFCVYWFRKAHDNIKENGYVGLVGTDTITQGYSRIDGLKYIVDNGGDIFNAVSSQTWSGDAQVIVSIVNWKKGQYKGDKKLFIEEDDNELILYSPDIIPSSLSKNFDVSDANNLECNMKPKKYYQGQTHGDNDFLLPNEDAEKMISKHPIYKEVLFPFLIGSELVSNTKGKPKRYVIDFGSKNLFEASKYVELFEIIKSNVRTTRKTKAEEQEKENLKLLEKNPKARLNKHHINFYKKWWTLSWARLDLIELINKQGLYIGCSRYTKNQVFEFISSEIHPNDKVGVFLFDDYYSYGIIQSTQHWSWFVEKNTSLGKTPGYGENQVWNSFPWPQKPTKKSVLEVAKRAKEFRNARLDLCEENDISYRELYKLIDLGGENKITILQAKLDAAVSQAYGFKMDGNYLQQLLKLNNRIFASEVSGQVVTPPGLPPTCDSKELPKVDKIISAS